MNRGAGLWRAIGQSHSRIDASELTWMDPPLAGNRPRQSDHWLYQYEPHRDFLISLAAVHEPEMSERIVCFK